MFPSAGLGSFLNYTTATARSSVLNVLKSKKELAMPMVSHLFGSPTLSGRVGKNGANSPIDVRIIKALLNTYQRKNGRPSLPMDTVDTDTLVTHIENFQKQQMKVTAPDGRIDPGGKTLSGLLQCLRGCYTVQSVTVPTEGRLTWETEGSEGGRYHSRRLHVPDGNSGLTLGRGYDLRERVAANVQADLANAGVAGNTAFRISTAAGKRGASASQFVIDNDLLDYEIAPQTQLKLFERVYEEKLKELKRVSELANTIQNYGKVDWKKLDQRILNVLVDLIYRGDYTKTSRVFLQKHIVANDFGKFKAEIAKKGNWSNVPQDRYERRKNYVETASPGG